jgi:ABC-type branched-subunit amino acid transport system ATPase component
MNRSALSPAPATENVRTMRAPRATACAVASTGTGIEIKSLEVRFGGVRALYNVDLTLRAGDILGLIGPNGSGKSTLFNAVTGFVPVASGSITLDGADLCQLPSSMRAHVGIARTFQTPRIDPDLKVHDAVMCGFYPSALPGMFASLLGLQHITGAERELRRKAADLLARLGLADVADTPLGALPLGQVRLVDVARAMAAGSRYLLLDEPAAGLAKSEQRRLIATVRDLAADGVGVLLVEHNFSMISELCENVIVLNRGEMLLRGPIRELRDRPEFIEAYLGSSGLSGNKPRAKAQPAEPVRVVEPEVALECSKLTASYGLIQACTGIGFRVSAGELLAVIGPNGAGKSSLLGAISGLVRNSGSLSLKGKRLDGLKAHDRVVAGIGFVPETRGNLFPPLTVRENLQIATQHVSSAERAEIFEYLLDLFPILSERMMTVAGMLSGGEQQMLAIAMAVGRKPAVLMLDEPSQGLAPAIYDALEGVCARLCKNGMGIILTEQNMPFAARVADRFIVLTHGHVSGEGTAAELSDPDSIIRRYFPDERLEEPVAAQK